MRAAAGCSLCALLACGEGVARAAAGAVSNDEESRLDEIGAEEEERVHAGDAGESQEDEEGPRRVGVSAELAQLGRITWSSARVELPIGQKFSVIPELSLLHIGAHGEGEPALWQPYFGAGVGFSSSDVTSFELSAAYAPAVDTLRSTGVSLSAWHAVDAPQDALPTLELDALLGANRVHWTDGLGPAGPDLLQVYGQLEAVIRPAPRWELRPNAMYFLYDRALDQAVGERLGSVSVLAHVGSYAPRALLGERVGYALGAVIAPWIEADEIFYASGIGHGVELLVGTRVDVAHVLRASLGCGLLLNRVGGPLVPTDDQQRQVPVVVAELERAFD